jgi:alcohol dehydrogenase
MQQLIYDGPGRLVFDEAPAPRLRGPAEALVRPIAVSRCDLDFAIARGRAPVAGPFPLGHECVAEIAALGEEVQGLSIGQRVVVPFAISCGACDRCLAGWTAYCRAVPPRSAYGLGDFGGPWGGFFSDLVRVPFAQAMLVPVPAQVDPAIVPAASDNLADAYRAIAPPLQRFPGGRVLIVAGRAPSVGLYAVAIARALGASDVDYLDGNADRLRIAERVGARALERSGKTAPDRLGPYPITVDASGTEDGIACALRSLEPGGICTSVGIYFTDTPVPLFDMYLTGVTFTTGIVSSRPLVPALLELVAAGRLHPELVTTRLASWEEAPEAILEPTTKVVVTRA